MNKLAHKLTPCADCPFLKGTPMSLRPGRVREIAGNMLSDGAGGPFPCHKTVNHDRRNLSKEMHCAGALLFAEHHGVQTQWMQVMGRLGYYDPARILKHKDKVFSSVEEMRKHLTRFEG